MSNPWYDDGITVGYPQHVWSDVPRESQEDQWGGGGSQRSNIYTVARW